jgi:zinc transport system permease protein
MELKDILEIISHPFMRNAFIIGLLISVCSALLGVILVLKRYSLIGHGLADVGFMSTALAVSVGFGATYFSMIMLTICSFVIMYLSQNKKMAGDIAIGIFSTGALALGVIISKDNKSDIYSYMFGSILVTDKTDVILSIVISVIVLSLFLIFYNRLFLITVDETFAKASGINIEFYQFLISFLTALVVVVGMKVMGSLLISSLVIFPTVIAKKIATSFKKLVAISSVISVFCFVIGITYSHILNTPVGASIVFAYLVVLLVSHIFSGVFKAIKK